MRGWSEKRVISRRAMLRGSARTGVGAAGLALVGCGGDDDEEAGVVAPPATDGSGAAAAVDSGADAEESAATEPSQAPAAAPEPDTAGAEEPAGEPSGGAEGAAEVEPAVVAARRGWERVAVEGPPARRNPVLVADPAGGALYVHGGRGSEGPVGDLWVFDGGWSEAVLAGDAPAARFSHAAAFLGGRLVVTTGQQTGFFSDVWAFDPAVEAWEELAPNGAGPTDRYGTGFAHDPGSERLLLSHGFTNDGRFDDTWSWGGEGWREDSPSGDRPGERCLHACAYDLQSGALLLFGGQNNSRSELGDTWVLVDGAWHEVTGPGPAARRFPGLTAVAGEAWLFGGTGEGNTYGDLWRFDFVSERWEAVALPEAPPARHSSGMAARPGSGEVFVFGGRGEDGDLADLWRLPV